MASTTAAPPDAAGSRRRPAPRSVEVIRTEQVSASMMRVILGGDSLATFPTPEYADSYVKVLFVDPSATYPEPFDAEVIRETMPPESWPVVRTYTVRAWDADRHELTLDFVTHGDPGGHASGVAGPWAASAKPGDRVLLQGPGGAYSPDPTAASHLFVGDESALPAISVALERLPGGAVAQAFIEVHGPEDEQVLDVTSGTTVTWVHRGDAPIGDRLVVAVTAADLGDAAHTSAFVHGEAGFVRTLRGWLRDQGVPRERTSISGYWRVGMDDEAWRVAKRQEATDA